MAKIKVVEGRCNFPKLEEDIIEFWKKGKIFEKSVESRSEDDRYSFVDGPPFVSGMPHPGTLAVSIVKDVIPRYWTMKGKRVRRVFGWDCHGLPIEEKVDKELGVKGREQVENEIGVEKYVQECRSYVERNIADWRWYIDRVGRWVDMDNAYRTMDPEFNQSVIWAFKQFHDKGLVYKGKRVSLFSTDTSTPVSEFEVAMDADNYRDTEDLSIFVKFRLLSEKFGSDVFAVAWTTTPWTIPSNFALAVNADYEYNLVEFEGEKLIIAKERLEYTFGEGEIKVLESFKGSELEGIEYEPVFDFFVSEKNENDFKIYVYEGVTLEEGTGILHVAPAFGAEDYELGLKHGISGIADIDERGILKVGSFEGKYIRDANEDIVEELKKFGKLLRSEIYTHRLPYYRGENPLIYMAQDSYLIDIQSLKDKILELNENVNWYPSHYKHRRFANTVKASPDWNISRTRFWATIMPIWRSEDGEEIVVGSFDEMMEYTDQIEKRVEDGESKYFFEGKKLFLHRDMCDKIVFEKDGKKYYRIAEVLDGWLDSGSVPFAEYGYPFKNEKIFENSFPADFVVEYTGQIRAWFAMLFRVSVAIFEKEPFKNVLCHGVLTGVDGRKLSKSFKNFDDPRQVLENTGGEAMRLYSMSLPIMSGGDAKWDDEILREQVKNILIPIWNTYRYLTLYANHHSWEPKNADYVGSNILDKWLRAYMNDVTLKYSEYLEQYNIPASVKLIQPTIDAISSWWIRRSRERLTGGDLDALQNLYACLVQFAKTFAPQMPFLTESMYQNLVVEAGIEDLKESVHLEYYPEDLERDNKLLEEMEVVRQVSSLGLSIRVEKQLKLRQPLTKAYANIKNDEMLEILKEELNVKEVEFAKKKEGKNIISKEEGGNFVALDVSITPELEEEGLFNDLTRTIQNLRKEEGCKVGEVVEVKFLQNLRS
jgi:isoleucyl-tRNA synthetase